MGHPSEREVVIARALRLLRNKPQEKLDMELDQVVYEYGKLQLNFVACQRANTQLATSLAQANKQLKELTDAKDGLAKVCDVEAQELVRLRDLLTEHDIAIPTAPEPQPSSAAPIPIDQQKTN